MEFLCPFVRWCCPAVFYCTVQGTAPCPATPYPVLTMHDAGAPCLRVQLLLTPCGVVQFMGHRKHSTGTQGCRCGSPWTWLAWCACCCRTSTHPVRVDVAQGPLQVGRRLISGSSWRQRHTGAVGLTGAVGWTGAGREPGVLAHARGMAVRHRRRHLFRFGRKDGQKALRGASRTRSCGRWGARGDKTYVGLWRGSRDVGLESPALPLGVGPGGRTLSVIMPIK